MKKFPTLEPDFIECTPVITATKNRAYVHCQKHGTRICSFRRARGSIIAAISKVAPRLWAKRKCKDVDPATVRDLATL